LFPPKICKFIAIRKSRQFQLMQCLLINFPAFTAACFFDLGIHEASKKKYSREMPKKYRNSLIFPKTFQTPSTKSSKFQ